ncbi:MAG TPA: hypothetical protein VJV75_02625, partial [Candidatus Polarisedimenticolia bacterium]|nr:hypothetical protein [Candidatus Polarisedimenticolia bacterium]
MPTDAPRAQTILALLLAGTALATAAAVDRVARAPRLAAWIDARDRARFERGEELYVNRGNYLEFEDRLLLEEIPA